MGRPRKQGGGGSDECKDDRSRGRALVVGAVRGAGSAVAATAQEEAGSTTAQSGEAGWPRIERGIVYGADVPEKQFMHVFRPEPREAPRPAVVLFHGGGLSTGHGVYA